MKHILPLLMVGLSMFANAQTVENFNLTHLAQYTYGSQQLSDVWGYVDEEGNEYAIVGRNQGVSIVNVTDSSNLFSVGEFTGNPTTWRDIKTWNDHAYVTCDACGNGLLIIDLSPLPQSTALNYTYWYGDTMTFQSAHNLFIDENGIAYIFGSNYSAGGAIFLDLTQDPMDPVPVGIYDEHYLHDGVVRGDTLWGAAIYAGDAQVIDVTDKASPQLMSAWKTPNAFTHNMWFSDDNNYLFTTDEVENGSVGAYDVSDIYNPTEVDVWRPSDSNIIVHNVHYMDEFIITSHYTIGVSILDVKRPDNMLEVGRYDTSPNYHEDGFHGCWGAYPWLPSGKLLATDMETGLHVFRPSYLHGCYLEGSVYDVHTGNPIFFPTITVLEDSLSAQGDIIGDYAVSVIDSGTYTLEVSADGYFPTVVQGVVLQNGEVTVQDVGLSNWPAGVDASGVRPTFSMYPNPGNERVHVRSTVPLEKVRVLTLSGAEAMHVSAKAGVTATMLDVSSLSSGIYLVEFLTAEGSFTERLTVN